MLCFGEEGFDAAAVLLDRYLVMCREDRSHKGFDVGVVALVVLGDGLAEPVQVALDRRLVRLLVAQ